MLGIPCRTQCLPPWTQLECPVTAKLTAADYCVTVMGTQCTIRGIPYTSFLVYLFNKSSPAYNILCGVCCLHLPFYNITVEGL